LLEALDSSLRKEVESLLAAEDDSFLDKTPAAVHSVAPETAEKSTGIRPLSAQTKTPDRIGPDRMLRKIGEGGMGIVYEAEQEKPVRRKVALKLIKWGAGEGESLYPSGVRAEPGSRFTNEPCLMLPTYF